MAVAEQSGDARLRTSSIGLWDVVFQSITYMAPGIGLAFSIGIGIQFSGETLPLSVVIGCLKDWTPKLRRAAVRPLAVAIVKRLRDEGFLTEFDMQGTTYYWRNVRRA